MIVLEIPYLEQMSSAMLAYQKQLTAKDAMDWWDVPRRYWHWLEQGEVQFRPFSFSAPDVPARTPALITAQFEPDGMDQLIMALELKSRQITQGLDYELGEPLKVLHPSALHCGI